MSRCPLLSRRSGVFGAALVLAFVGVVAPVATASAAPPRGATSDPPPGVLDGVSCPTTGFCAAVGSDGTHTLVETRTSSGWQPVTLGIKRFLGMADVSCASTTSCVAVGSNTNPSTSRTVATSLVYDGSHWSQVTVPAPSASAYAPILSDVSCSGAARCVAVGQYYAAIDSGELLPFAVQWNGTRWRLIAMSLPFTASSSTVVQALSVSCPPGGTSCVAVGVARQFSSDPTTPFIDVLSGGRWKSVAGVSGTGALYSVSCTTSSSCVAVGEVAGSTALAEVRNGTHWTATTPAGVTPADVDAEGVSCATTGSCVVAGSQTVAGSTQLFTATLTSGGWTTADPAGIANYPHFYDVSCPVVAFCVAVGYDSGGDGLARLAESGDGTTWQLEAA